MPTFKIIMDPRTTVRNDGTRTLVLRVSEKTVRNYIPLGLKVKADNWDVTLSKFKRAHDPITFKELNNDLRTYLSDCEKILSEFAVNKIPFSFNHFKSKFLIPKDIPGLYEFFDTTIKKMKDREQIGNATVYFYTKKRLTTYSKRKELSFQEITPSFLEGFESFLIKERCSGNTIHHYMRTLRALYYRAVAIGFANPELNPFYNNYTRKGYRFSHLLKATSKRALSKAELKKLMEYNPAPLSREEDAKNIFLFSYYAWGINIVDIAKLRWDKDIRQNHIVYLRTKTRYTKEFKVPIIEPLREILSVCREYSPKGYVFTILNDSITDPTAQHTRIKIATRGINDVLKNIGDDLKIQVPLTTYVARHTFASVMKSQGTTAAVIREMMGHKKEETTQMYLKDIADVDLDQNSAKLILS